MILWRDFTFEAAHRLPRVGEGHRCARLHGHSWHVRVLVEGPVDSDMGWVCDFADVKAAWRPLDEALDHRYLNEIPGLDNPTSENVAAWIWERLAVSLPGLVAIEIRETCTSGVRYSGPTRRTEANA